LKLSLEQDLILGANALGLALTNQQTSQLLAYIEMLQKWNQVYNLTAIKDPQQMLIQHVLDCLAVVSPLKEMAANAQTLLDVGAGGGLPSVILAIACPSLRVLAVDAVAKKSAFIQTVAHTLGLANLQGLHARIETLSQPFDVVCSRAFASLADFVSGTRESLLPNGLWMAMKGQVPEAEIAELPKDIAHISTQSLQVPGLDAQRCLVWMRKK
jgi:16S rRNA (guanine527-N7)-methyltransferase